MPHQLRDLSHPDYTPPDVPEWAREEGPDWVAPYRGINGLPDAWQQFFPRANVMNTLGLDRYQANHFVTWRPETASYLKDHYTSLEVGYRAGTFPELEQIAVAAMGAVHTCDAKVEAFLSGPGHSLKHPYVPPLGPPTPGSRNLGELELLRSGAAWCNEQARVFIRLCQTQNIPARMIHFFYKNLPSGHTAAEYHTGQSWCLVDVSYFIIFRTDDGVPLSAADCHDRGPGQRQFGKLYTATLHRLVEEAEALPPQDRPERLENFIKTRKHRTADECSAELDFFGVMNYPLPKG